tara:strand:+ start:13991 stop:14356 length:366 start_codon:yes stop_codon:yes gene_type:complete
MENPNGKTVAQKMYEKFAMLTKTLLLSKKAKSVVTVMRAIDRSDNESLVICLDTKKAIIPIAKLLSAEECRSFDYDRYTHEEVTKVFWDLLSKDKRVTPDDFNCISRYGEEQFESLLKSWD